MAQIHSQTQIDDRVFRFGYNFNDICDAEEVAGCNLLDAVAKIISGGGGPLVTATQLRGLVYAMLVPDGGYPRKAEDLLKFAGSLVRVDTMGGLVLAIGEACSLAISEERGAQFREAIKQQEPPTTDPPADLPTPEEPSASA